MAKKLNEGEHAKILAEARRRFKRCQDWESKARTHFVDDIKFNAGDSDNLFQWPEDVRTRMTENTRAMLTINKTHQHCLDILNDARQSRVSIKIRPTGGGSNVDSAEVYMGVIRHIEYISNASTAYQTALSFAVRGGWGYWRLVTDYANDDSFDQEIFIRPVNDPLSVFLDPDIHQFDGSDAKFGFVYTEYDKEEFEVEYPEWKGRAADSSLGDNSWARNKVRIAEYFRRVQTKDRLFAYPDPADPTGKAMKTVRESELEPSLAKVLARQSTTTIRSIKSHKVEWFKIIGDNVTEEREWLGIYIPIIRCIGNETVIDGQLDRPGHVRALKDPQRMFNYNAPLALDTRLPTPGGWTTMGDVQPGDLLLGSDGHPVKVGGLSPVFEGRACFRIEFDDGSHIVADGEHLWTVEERRRLRRMGTPEWSIKTLTTAELDPRKHFIWATNPIDLPPAKLPIDPYVLGVWLGDGSSKSATIHSGLADMAEMREILSACGYEVGAPRIYAGSGAAEMTVFGLHSQLAANGLLKNKHIPAAYLRASFDQRTALLQGLMDTDGNIAKWPRTCSFTSTFPALAEGFAELVRSLGIKVFARRVKGTAAKFPNGKVYERKDAVRFHFTADPSHPLFRLERKRALQTEARALHPRRTKRHRIIAVVPESSVPVRCIGVESPWHLFLAGESMIPTHNSGSVEFGALQSKTPYTGPADAIEGYEEIWDTANTINHSYLPHNHRDDQGDDIPAPVRQQPPTSAPVFMEGMKDAAEWMRMVSGQYQSDMGAPSNERSGVAITARQRQGDNATFHFLDHESIAIRFTGKQLIDLIPKYYDTERVIKIMGQDGTTETEVTVDPQAKDALTEVRKTRDAVETIFNPRVGEYDVEADVGAAYATARQEAFNAFSQILSQNKELTSLIGDLALQAADFPGAEEAAKRLKRMVPQQALEDGPAPDVIALQKQIQQMSSLMQTLAGKLADKTAAHQNDAEKNAISGYDAQTKRLAAVKDYLQAAGPELLISLVTQIIQEAESTSAEGMSPALTPTPVLTGQQFLPPPAGGGGEPPGAPGAPAAPGTAAGMPVNAEPGDMGSGPPATPGAGSAPPPA